MLRKAFTLAEVLVTLTIIGVIAAITIPNLMQSYKKHQVEVGVKAAYSILSNALAMAKADEKADDITDMLHRMNPSGSSGQIDMDAKYNFFAENYLVPYLKVVKTCPYGESDLCSNCDILCNVYKLDGKIHDNRGDQNPYQRYRILLSNGMYIGVGIDQSQGAYALSFMVDINGAKGPNRFGYDIFYFVIDGADCTHENSYYCAKLNTIRGGGWGTSDYTFLNGTCDNSGWYCSAVIQRNGWRIPDNYPVKRF